MIGRGLVVSDHARMGGRAFSSDDEDGLVDRQGEGGHTSCWLIPGVLTFSTGRPVCCHVLF